MKVFGQLEEAQLQNRTSNPSAGVAGKIWFNTVDGIVYLDNASILKKFLINDGNIVIGTNGTANNNVRLHRAANEVLQFVKGGDSTAEGSLSANLAQISAKHESYTNAGKPSATVGNAGRVIHISDLDVLQRNTEAGAWETIVSNPTKLQIFNDTIQIDTPESSVLGVKHFRVPNALSISVMIVQLFEKNGVSSGTLEIDIKKNSSPDNTGMTTIFSAKPSFDFSTASDYDTSSGTISTASASAGDYYRLDLTSIPAGWSGFIQVVCYA